MVMSSAWARAWRVDSPVEEENWELRSKALYFRQCFSAAARVLTSNHACDGDHACCWVPGCPDGRSRI